ncbi:MAG: hypothetical protein HYU43_03060 [Armatimonadetes bacterium]|nr:hypothetical protein [Planctomycetota bacterium]MBI2200900.1 hypothetical protein [Armatimonadota bacterium]
MVSLPSWRFLSVITVFGAVASFGQSDPPRTFGSPENGLSSRLVVNRDRFEQGQPVWLYLDVYNGGGEPVSLVTGGGVWGALHVTREDGYALKEADPAPPDHVYMKAISAGKQANLVAFFASGNAYAMFPVLEPGRYQAVWNPQGEASFHEKRLAPRSNPVAFEIVPRQDAEEVPHSLAPEIPFGTPSEQGLQCRVRSERDKFLAGRLITVHVEVHHAGAQAAVYAAWASPEAVDFELLDAAGTPVPTLIPTEEPTPFGGTRSIEANHTALLHSIDLSGRFFLQRPGQYSVRVLAAPRWIPGSDWFNFEVLPAEILDPLQRALRVLFEHCPAGWTVGAGLSESGLEQPGPQWSRVPCRHYRFFIPEESDRTFGTEPDVFPIHFYLATEKAVEEPWEVKEYYEPFRTEYMGRTAFGHLYLIKLHPSTLKAWPTAKADLLNWLGKE